MIFSKKYSNKTFTEKLKETNEISNLPFYQNAAKKSYFTSFKLIIFLFPITGTTAFLPISHGNEIDSYITFLGVEHIV